MADIIGERRDAEADAFGGIGLALAVERLVYSAEVGRVYRPEVGQRADVKRATYTDPKRAIWDAPARVM